MVDIGNIFQVLSAILPLVISAGRMSLLFGMPGVKGSGFRVQGLGSRAWRFRAASRGSRMCLFEYRYIDANLHGIYPEPWMNLSHALV